jgi:hypothetical protein
MEKWLYKQKINIDKVVNKNFSIMNGIFPDSK